MRKLYCLLATGVMLLLSACGGAAPAEYASEGNPLRSVTAEQMEAELGVRFSLPEGAQDADYTIISGEQPLAQVTFLLDGATCCCRAQSADIPGEELPDISGMYYTWEERATDLVGYNEALLSWIEGQEGVIRWYDYAPGLLYSVSVSSGAGMAELIALAEEIYVPVQEWTDDAEDTVNAPAELTNLLAAISQKYESGVMGSSLRAVKYAATLMDWFTAHPVSGEEVNAAVLDFLSTLDTGALETFPEKLEAVHDAANELYGEERDGWLDTCGYEAMYDHWDQAQMERYFDLIWEIVGEKNG